MEGKIIVVVFPQDNHQKLRPALVLREFPKYGDVLVCGITSQLHQHITGFDLLIDDKHPDFLISGLKTSGLCRLNMLTMLSRKSILGSIGYVSLETHNELLRNLAGYLVKNIKG